MAVSGEFKYFGPAFSSVARVRPVKAMIFAASLVMGNMTRLRNLEYMLTAGFGLRLSGFGLWASGFGEPSFSVPAIPSGLSFRSELGVCFCCPLPADT